MSKFESRAHEGIFVGYATNSHAYRVLNKSIGLIEETCNIEFDDNNSSQVEQSGTCDVGDEIPPQAIRRMLEICPRGNNKRIIIIFPCS